MVAQPQNYQELLTTNEIHGEYNRHIRLSSAIEDLSEIQILNLENEIKEIAGEDCISVDIISSGESVFIYSKGFEPLTGVTLYKIKEYLASNGFLSSSEKMLDYLEIDEVSERSHASVGKILLNMNKVSLLQYTNQMIVNQLRNPKTKA
jgi:hypothetical protein